MTFALIFNETKDEMGKRDDPSESGAYWASWTAYTQAMTDAGVSVGGAGLQPPVTATTLRVVDGERQVQDGPFAETKEQLGGFILIEVEDLDAALEWAARSPAASGGSVEVRPTLPPPPGN